jgi:hypothetical protein
MIASPRLHKTTTDTTGRHHLRKVHRIVVAHGAGERCRATLGGTGSLIISPRVVGEAHYDPSHQDFAPFTIGIVDDRHGFIHVVDDFSLDALLTTLDTTADLAAYLQKKEALIARDRLIGAAGDEDLLAYYVSRMNDSGEHDFVVPQGYGSIGVDEGFWSTHITHPDRIAQVHANSVSYAWDRLIEKFTHHAVTGTQYTCSHPAIDEQEVILRFLAKENRTRRRMLAKALLGIMKKGDSNEIAARVSPDRPLLRRVSYLQARLSRSVLCGREAQVAGSPSCCGDRHRAARPQGRPVRGPAPSRHGVVGR